MARCWPTCSCTFMCCFYVYYSAIFFFGIFSFITWLIFLPQELKFAVTDASLTQFEYNSTANNTLLYNMALNITIRNSNKRVGVYYNRIQAISQYGKKRFSMVTLTNSTPFYQGRKNTTIISAVIQGQQVLLFKDKELKKYNTETNAGVYSIEVRLALRVKARYGKLKTRYYKPQEKVSCKLKLPLLVNNSINGTASIANSIKFKATWCGNVYVLTTKNDGG
ncbi:hypothetical protein FNV43_RR15588 [Rhamnella rubrinervis]|uniref:Late embryogenesis abundant protein LEA-2 subgroup domain-containing protein n=1 Tax=Rhamnella rubrinervis TaxID=2594499 RepID=A0A8K0GXI8_9ROSA|nr:hypothetical protein FNV43_RR15588 [Rhamnella rubrinervis]